MPHRSSTVTVVLLITSIMLSMAVAEGIARFFISLPQGTIYPQVRYQPHPVRGFTLKPNQKAYTKDESATIDVKGFRINGTTATTGIPTLRILALGDSFTFGYGVADHETWPAMLEQKLGPGVRVTNAGTTSYNVFHELDLFREKGAGLNPEVVIHGLYWNDHLMNRPPRPTDPALLTSDGHFTWDGDDNPAGEPLWLSWARWLKGHSVLAYAVHTQARRYLVSQNSGVHQYDAEYRKLLAGNLVTEEWQDVENFYEEIKRLGEKSGFKVYVIIFPVRDIITMPDPVNHAYPRHIRGILDRHRIPYLDGFALWHQAQLGISLFLPYDEHLTAEGYRIVSEAAAVKFCSIGASSQLKRSLSC